MTLQRVSPDGRLFLEGVVRAAAPGAAANKYLLLLRRTEDGSVVKEIDFPHESRLLVFSPDARFFAAYAGSDDPQVHLYETKSGQLAGRLTPGDGVVLALAFSEDNSLLATSHRDGSVLIWDLATAAKMNVVPQP
jgi:WD40 repeat protein